MTGEYADVELSGKEREQALAECHSQLRLWGLVMPAVEPLVLDFGLGCFREAGLIEYWVANEQESGYCGKFLFLLAGQTCPEHRHIKKHETFLVMKGEVEMGGGGEVCRLGEGALLSMPPGRAHRFTALGAALLLEVSSPSLRHDNLFTDKRIGENGLL